MCRKSIDRAPVSPQEFRRTFPLAALGEFLSDAEIETIVRQYRTTVRHRVFTPGLTVRAMTYRGLFPDRSIRALLADLAPHLPPTTDVPTPSAFCQARSRLPKKVLPTLIDRSADRLEHQAGTKIGRNEWIVPLRLAPQLRRRYNDPTLPDIILVRLIRVCFRRGETLHVLWLYTTLLDPVKYPRRQLVRLYRKRWGIETRIGSLKTTLQLNVLRSKTPANVRREVAATILAHNLVWTVIHQAVRGTRTPADRVSFTGAVRTIVAFSPVLRWASEVERVGLYIRMLRHIRAHTNLYRPNRIEPRLVKREPVRYGYLRIPRDEARRKCLS